MSTRLLTIEGVFDGQKIQFQKDKEFVYAVTGEIREGLAKAGISEEEILKEFDQFRRTLPNE